MDGSEASYGYDSTDQLINEQRTGANAYNTTYAYDPVGNRLTKNDGGQITTCSYNAGNELTLLTPPSGAPTTSTYDANGNLLTENAGGTVTTYAWDYENRLINVSSPSGVEMYSYSADGMREEKANSAGTVYYVRDGENVLIETDATHHPGALHRLSGNVGRAGIRETWRCFQLLRLRPAGKHALSGLPRRGDHGRISLQGLRGGVGCFRIHAQFAEIWRPGRVLAG